MGGSNACVEAVQQLQSEPFDKIYCINSQTGQIAKLKE